MRSLSVILMLLMISASLLAVTSYWPNKPRPQALDTELWQQFQFKFIDSGRVIDRENGGISHSEGQGYGMILAAAANDRQSFDELLEWTHNNLMRDDGLLSWKWEVGSGITDPNNATDGDILVAWALLRASRQWSDPRYQNDALQILNTIESKALIEVAGRRYILPGVDGFRKAEGPILNPSYWVYPALDDFADLENGSIWSEVAEAGVWLVQQLEESSYGLAPDWIQLLPDGVQAAPGFPPRFSWDAIRVPLYLAWGDEKRHALLDPYRDFWKNSSAGDQIPAWIDVETGEIATYQAPSGIDTLAKSIGDPMTNLDLVSVELDESYYSSTLLLLTLLARDEWTLGSGK